MNRLILAAVLTAGCALVSSAPALGAARNYDCSKPGNANKAACKTAAAKPPAAKSAPAAKAAPKVATATKTTTTRTYDCTKAGNANKAQCKGSTKVATTTTTTKTAPRVAAPASPGMFQRLKNAMSGSPPAVPTAKPAPKPAAPRRTAAAPASVEDHNPAGAIAQCKDGTYSHAKIRTGACSRHGGVGKWS